MDKLPSEIRIIRQISRVKQIEFAMVFVTSQTTIDNVVPKLARKFADDVVLWMCYPKKSSKRYTCDFNRDSGWDVLGQHDMEGVRIVAIDEDWSALRFLSSGSHQDNEANQVTDTQQKRGSQNASDSQEDGG